MPRRKSFNPENVGLGRKRAADSRDERYLLRSIIPPAPKKAEQRTYKYWGDSGIVLNQGNTSSCVGHAFKHLLLDGPIANKSPHPDPFHIYRVAQDNDEWPGAEPIYSGTSVRAGANVLVQEGLFESYYWAWDLQTLIDALLNLGPVVAGTTWYEGMFFPDSKGLVKITGSAAGGHAWKLDGINVKKGRFRAKQSWGEEWGLKGRFYIEFDEMQQLIYDYGEICVGKEVKKLAA